MEKHSLFKALKDTPLRIHALTDGPLRIRKGRTRRVYSEGLTGSIERVCPGGRHAWIRTAIGLIRKPYAKV